ncbi:sensor histidine kinase [Methylovirgula sp. 4M-Z18]|uniref:sensor histidine kinase n=1 Tax=Methylovirgula sp. 4M-Z18 TaxID=2293567 RepID=UPI000E2E8B82|nr:ATP-binding protein [Methylovirgula sp. 4M-Z18]RFB80961.1 hypothetical protein DYH55_05690 [Methylovirgula sp. 4M-Z18]
MTPDLPLEEALQISNAASRLIAANVFGFCDVDGNGIVIHRVGTLSLWAPEEGSNLFEAPLMMGFEASIREAAQTPGTTITLPDLGLVIEGTVRRLDLRFVWQDHDHLMVVSYDVGERHDLLVSLNQTRREQRIAQDQIALQQRQLAEQAQSLSIANTDLKRFSLAMSHDLQAPVRQIRRFADLIAEDGHGLDERRLDFLHEIAAGAARMQAMIVTLLRYMRIAQQEASFSDIRLEDAFEIAKSNLRSDIAAAQAEIAVGALPAVHGDEALLALVFQNLMQNSLKYRSAAPPRIHIQATVLDGVADIAVTDNGRGIDPASAPKAFALFQRLNSDPTISGVGAGLPVCQRIIEMHAGRIWIDTDWREGLRVRFTLPLARAN